MKIVRNISLKDYNTFGIDARARHFVEISNLDDLKEVLQRNRIPGKIDHKRWK